MKTGSNGLKVIKAFEGCRLNSYQDQKGIWTIGYGHTQGVHQGDICTQSTANVLLAMDLNTFENDLNSMIFTAINQNEFDALMSFIYNLGAANLKGSHLLSAVNHNDLSASAEFLKWGNVKVGGVLKHDPGLYRRRQVEQQLFTTPVTTIFTFTV